MDYTIETVGHLFKTDFSDFFLETCEDMEREAQLNTNPDHVNHRFVVDTKNHIVSIHHFPKNISSEEGKANFQKMMGKRAKHLVSILKQSRKIAFLCNRMETIQQFRVFLEAMHGKFPQAYFTLINMRHDETMELQEIRLDRHRGNHYEILDYSFCDKNETGGLREDWKGSMACWHSVLKHVRLSRSVGTEASLRSFDDD